MTTELRDVKTDHTLEAWESWVDEAIRGAQDRGDFDNLPGAGEPLQLDRNPLAGDRKAAFHVLKNADVAPYWMELDKELSKSIADLETFRERAVARVERLRTRSYAPSPQATARRTTGRGSTMLRWLRGPGDSAAGSDQTSHVRSLERERQDARRQFLDKAATVDKLIVEYNSSLPAEIRWLERPRLLPDQAGRRFDAVWPTVRGATTDE